MKEIILFSFTRLEATNSVRAIPDPGAGLLLSLPENAKRLNNSVKVSNVLETLVL